MRIFYASSASPNAYNIKESNLWKNNLFDSLVDMGHEVINFSRDVTWHFSEYTHYMSSEAEREKFLKYRSDLQVWLVEEILAEHRKKKIDLFFSYFWSEICDPETILKIKAAGIKTVNWYCNGSYQFDLVADLAPVYDWCLVAEKFRLPDYRRVGANPIYCQEAANPNIYKPYDLPVEFDVVFVGQAYGDRPAYIRYLLDEGIDVRVWGSGWQNFAPQAGARPRTFERAVRIGRKLLTPQGWALAGQRLSRVLDGRALEAQGSAATLPTLTTPGVSTVTAAAAAPAAPPVVLPTEIMGGILSDIDMVKLYSRSKINLGFSTCGDTHQSEERIMQVRLRDFEVPMSGGFYMVEYMEELEEFFEIGKEIVCYTDKEDLADKIKYYLRNDSEREAIRKAGHERCLRDHSWQKRLSTAFKEMGLN